MTKFWQKVAGMAVAGALMVGTSVTVMAAPDSAGQTGADKQAAKAEKQAAKLAEKQADPQAAALKAMKDQLEKLHEAIGEQRDLLKGKLTTIKALVADLKQDPEKNKKQLEIAKADMREMRLLDGDRKQINTQLEAAHAALKQAVDAKDWAAALAEAEHIRSLLGTKLDVFRTLNNKADQVIAHLRAAN